MIKYIKEWYDANFTDPNQVSLALILIFSTLITYILIQTIAPILVAIVLAYMLEGLVQNLMKTTNIVRNISVIVVFLIFLVVSILTMFMLIPLLLDQLTLFVKSLPDIFDKSKNLILGMYNENEYIPKDYIDKLFLGLQGETSKLGNSIFAFSLASAGGLFAIIVYTILVPIMIFFMLFDKDAINNWISKFFPKKLELTQRAYSELNLKIGKFPFIGNGKAIALGDSEGLIKTIFDQDTGELIGAHMVGPEVTELIQGFSIAKKLETTEQELMHTIFPHPTLSEGIHESVLDAYNQAIHY